MNELDPSLRIEVLERLDRVAMESSAGRNNAGTGHAGYCELNYTPEDARGAISTQRAVAVNEQWELSKQFWAYQVQQKRLIEPSSFITHVPHVSFVWGREDVDFLRRRHAALQQHVLFKGMKFSADRAEVGRWMPLTMRGRTASQPVAATWMDIGCDVNFGAITTQLVAALQRQPGVRVSTGHEARDIQRHADGKRWVVRVRDTRAGTEALLTTRFLFIGAGGGALRLLQMTGVPEADGYGGLPVGGIFLRTANPALVEQHAVNAYGKAPEGAPPMSTPHLDRRHLDGRKELFFGPFANFSTRHLVEGSRTDVLTTLNARNIVPKVQAAWDNRSLITFLVGELRKGREDMFEDLKKFYPEAKLDDWELHHAGKRVQIIRPDDDGRGSLEFGTELVTSADGTMAALLGASPGASTSPAIMLDVLEKSFADRMPAWRARLTEILPSLGKSLDADASLTNSVRERTHALLGLPKLVVNV